MNVMELVATLTLDSSKYEKQLTGEKEKTSKLGAAAGLAWKGTAVAVGAVATGVSYLTKKSVDAYKDYEQLAGGVKKLYGDAADELMGYANNAYATSGMSANKYMEQATSFSAALINSLGGDTSKAAKQTDVAMRAISDNYNTFGGDMQNLQNAFQGFAKQNYTMLDNLKLGYGGTKTEMARLVKDANEYAKSIGMAGNLSMDSFSDIVTAIDLVQQKQGIAGTTAKEAATTIEGSLNMTKAAWENLVAGLANPDADIGKLMDNLITAIVGDKEGTGLLNQIVPAIQRAFEGIGQFLQAAIPVLAQQLPPLIQSFLPVVIDAVITLVSSLAQSLPDILMTLAEMLPDIVDKVINGIVDAIIAGAPILAKAAPKLVISLANGIVRSIGVLRSAGRRLVSALASAISSGLSSLAGKAKGLAKKVWNNIKAGLGSLVSVGANLIEGLWNGIKAKFDGVVARVKALAAKLPAAVKKVLGIASPPKVFMEVGKWIPEGLALGIERNMGSVLNAADTMADATSFVPHGSASLGARLGNQIINSITVDGAENPEDFANRLVRQMELDMRTV